jgi:hypothetical protein
MFFFQLINQVAYALFTKPVDMDSGIEIFYDVFGSAVFEIKLHETQSVQ